MFLSEVSGFILGTRTTDFDLISVELRTFLLSVKKKQKTPTEAVPLLFSDRSRSHGEFNDSQNILLNMKTDPDEF